MKFNYKKVASIFASAIMLSSTIGFAAAATYPSPFTGGAAVVYGENAATTDMAAAIDIYKDLSSKTTTTSSSSTTAVSGEAKPIETGGQKLYLGDYMNTTKSAFTKTELPTVLADGKISDADGTSFDYNQKINTPNTLVNYGRTVDYLATPILYIDLGTSQSYSMDITFPTSVNVTKLTSKDITLFGKKYTFSGSESDLSTSKVVLFENAQSQIVKSGESADVTVEGTKHTIAVTSVEDGNNAIITVDGVSQAIVQGNSYKVSGLDLYAKNVIGPGVAGETRAVELYLGSSKITLDGAGATVLKGSTSLYGVTSTFTHAGGKVSKISVTVTPSGLTKGISYIPLGGNSSMTDPLFGTFKISFGSVEPGLKDSSRDEILIKPSGDTRGHLKFTNINGQLYDLDVFKLANVCVDSVGKSNATGNNVCDTTTYKYNATTFGSDTYDVITTATGQANKNDYVITGSVQYSQIWKITDINIPSKQVTLRDVGSDSSQTLSFSAMTEGTTATSGLNLADSSIAIVNLTGNGTTGSNVTIDKAVNYVYTKNGALINMSALSNPTNTSLSVIGQKIVITEETSYNDGTYTSGSTTLGASSINVSVLYDASKTSGYKIWLANLQSPDGYTSGSDNSNNNYYITKYGSYIEYFGQNDKTFDMYYPKSAAAMKVYIGEVASSITPGSTGTATGAVTIVKDSEVASVSDKNLVVIGGSCINTVAAKILGSDVPLCAEDFGLATKTSAGGYIIKTVTSPYNTGKVAMLVAGYNAADTQNAAARAVQSDVKTDVGSEEVYPVTA